MKKIKYIFYKYFLPGKYAEKIIKQEIGKFDIRNNDLNYSIENIRYEVFDEIKNNIKLKFPNVLSKEDGIDLIIKNKASMSRFGDGEFVIACGYNMAFQEKIGNITERLQSILKEGSKKDFLCCVPDTFGSLEKYKEIDINHFRRFMGEYRSKIFNYMDLSKIYYDNLITRPYMIYKNNSMQSYKNYFNKMKDIWREREIIIIEGEKSRLGMGNDLFDNTKNIGRILCPVKNAYNKYEEILKEANKIDKNKLILIALGPTATILAYDLYNLGYQALDIGHIDIEYEWFLMGATTKIPIKDKYVLETGSINIESSGNQKYQSQIISKIL